ncbi:hypothetical protein Tco_1024891 [Tanacetum coccineum]
MVDMVNQRKKHFAEERAKAKRNKPMTKSQLRIYMSNYLKNQGTWKLSQLKKLKFEEIKEEFDKLVQQIDTFVPINLKATKAKLKRYGEELQTKTSKKQRIDDKDVPVIGEKVVEVKEEEQVKRTGKRKKQKARKGINVDKSAQEDSETDKEESVEAMNPTPLTTKSDSVANWKIFQQGQRSVYQIIRANRADTVYMSFGAMIKDFTREDLIELYRLVMQKYGTNRPEDAYDRVLWSDLRTMFDPPLIEDAIWSLPLQQKMVSWRYYDKCEVHCLTLEACTIYMLADRKYPLSKEACQVMLKMKLLDGKMNEVCYKLLKMIEKQAGIRKYYIILLFLWSTNRCARATSNANLPYGIFLTRLYQQVIELYPHLDNGIYNVIDRVMRPLTLKQTRRPQSDHGKARHSVSSTSAHHNLGSSSHQGDDDEDDGASCASTPSL